MGGGGGSSGEQFSDLVCGRVGYEEVLRLLAGRSVLSTWEETDSKNDQAIRGVLSEDDPAWSANSLGDAQQTVEKSLVMTSFAAYTPEHVQRMLATPSVFDALLDGATADSNQVVELFEQRSVAALTSGISLRLNPVVVLVGVLLYLTAVAVVLQRLHRARNQVRIHTEEPFRGTGPSLRAWRRR